MYYLKPDQDGRCAIYGYEPEKPYLTVDRLPPALPYRANCEQVIFTELKTAWRQYVSVFPDETQRLKEKVLELEQVVADLASLQLEVMLNG